MLCLLYNKISTTLKNLGSIPACFSTFDELGCEILMHSCSRRSSVGRAHAYNSDILGSIPACFSTFDEFGCEIFMDITYLGHISCSRRSSVGRAQAYNSEGPEVEFKEIPWGLKF
jgi:hypothetical protein